MKNQEFEMEQHRILPMISAVLRPSHQTSPRKAQTCATDIRYVSLRQREKGRREKYFLFANRERESSLGSLTV